MFQRVSTQNAFSLVNVAKSAGLPQFLMSRNLSPIRVLRPSGVPHHTGTVIFFHGSGSTGEGCEEYDVGYAMRKRFDFPHLKVLFPTAPFQPYSPLGGERSNVWFDRHAISSSAPENLKSIESIKDVVMKLIEKENAEGIPNNRIIVGGISMGGAMAMYTGLGWENSVAGVFALSSFLNHNSFVYKHLETSKSAKPKLIQFHGGYDEMVPLQSAKDTFDKLKSLGIDGEFVFDPKGEHMPNRDQLLRVHSWIEKILPPL